MPVEVIMPKVDMDMEKGKLSVWHISEGTKVEKGAPLFDIETDKAAMEVEAPATGTLHHVLASAGTDVPVGQPVAWLYADDEEVGASPQAELKPAIAAPDAPPKTTEPVPRPAASTCAPQQATAHAPGRTGVRATPAARRLAKGAGIDLTSLSGSGPSGRIQAADVERATAVAPAATAPLPSPVIWEPQAGPLHVSRTDGEGVPLILLHGFGADSYGWRPLEQAMRSTRPLIRIDLPSHGRSPLARISAFRDLSRRVVECFDSLHLDGPVNLLGHSLGGALALSLADIRPRGIRSLCLIAPAGLGSEIDGATLNGIARASRAESLAPWLKRLTATPDGISWDFAKAAMMTREDPALRSAQLDLADVLFPDGTQAFDLTAALDRLEMPTSIVWGRRDRVLPWRHAMAANGNIALHFLREAGHIPHMECPAEVAAILSRHIAAAA